MNKIAVNNKDIIFDLQDYMFTSNNINKYTKHIIQINLIPQSIKPPKLDKVIEPTNTPNDRKIPNDRKTQNTKKETMYTPKQKDSLFWCFYILKNGFSNYEMDIYNQYFVVEKNEKFKYIDMLRKNKDLLKIHKIKPYTELEDDLANKERISIKTFFALCILENINVLLINKRKVYELLCTDVNEKNPIHIIHRNSESYQHSIELDVTEEIINKYKDTYYKMSNFDASLKSISSYKLDELLDLCKKLDINISAKYNSKIEDNIKIEDKQKITKKDIYELLVLNY